MGDIPLFPHVNSLYYIYHKAAIYNLTTLCLNGTLPCVDSMDVTMGDISLCPSKRGWNITGVVLCLRQWIQYQLILFRNDSDIFSGNPKLGTVSSFWVRKAYWQNSVACPLMSD